MLPGDVDAHLLHRLHRVRVDLTRRRAARAHDLEAVPGVVPQEPLLRAEFWVDKNSTFCFLWVSLWVPTIDLLLLFPIRSRAVAG